MAEVDRPRRRQSGKKGGAPRRLRTSAAIAEVARVLGAVASGDLSQTMALDIDGAPIGGALLPVLFEGEVRALVVVDDVRKIHGLATVLEEAGMSVAFAEDRTDALVSLVRALLRTVGAA